MTIRISDHTRQTAVVILPSELAQPDPDASVTNCLSIVLDILQFSQILCWQTVLAGTLYNDCMIQSTGSPVLQQGLDHEVGDCLHHLTISQLHLNSEHHDDREFDDHTLTFFLLYTLGTPSCLSSLLM